MVGPDTASGLEFKGFSTNDEETPWLGAGEICDFRDRWLPLTGFAVRSPDRKYHVVYKGRFMSGAEVGPLSDGEPCLSATPEDALMAIQISLRERRRG